MFDKKLLALVGNAKQYIAGNILLQWISLLCNIYITLCAAFLLQEAAAGTLRFAAWGLRFAGIGIALFIRVACTRKIADLTCLSSERVKKVLREKLFSKLLFLGRGYTGKVSTAEAVQVAVEGTEQLDVYYAKYLPQMFYSLIAPLTLFAVLAPFSISIAAVLFVCVPLIPITIMVIQKIAKKLLSKYWKSYTGLGDEFLENLQGLTTLKIYGADAYKNKQMNERAEEFRKITMRVLVMQLNSISVMDLVAYGGAAAGAVLSVSAFANGMLSLGQALAFILLAAEFFIPMRMLGSYFHVAMNGMAASGRMFRILELEAPAQGKEMVMEPRAEIALKEVSFAYAPGEPVLENINMQFPAGRLTAIAGESGCGKSTIAAILAGAYAPQRGRVMAGLQTLSSIRQDAWMKHVTLLSHDSYIFRGTLRQNLLIGNPRADDSILLSALKRARLLDFVMEQAGGLDMRLQEGAANLSGGQRQRLAFARALLHDTPVYIFDEATSNIDAESEEALLQAIYELAEERTVILISHRLASAVPAGHIYVMQVGRIAEQGTHQALMQKKGTYAALFSLQKELEAFRKEEAHDAAV